MQKLVVPVLKPSLFIGRSHFSLLVDNFVAQKEVEGLLEEIHLHMSSHFDAIDYLVLAQVGSAHNPCLFLEERRPFFRVGTGQPNEGVED